MGGDREGQPEIHAAGVEFDRRVDERRDFGESDDLVELPADFRAPHAENGTVQEDVLASGELRMEAGPDLQQ